MLAHDPVEMPRCHLPQHVGKLPRNHRPVKLRRQSHGSLLKSPARLSIAEKKKNGVCKRRSIIGKQQILPFWKLSPSAPMEVETSALPIAIAS